MKIFIPKKIKVGFQNRESTYTGKLSYVIYYDHENKLRKETSWNSWIDANISFDDFANEPTNGFVLNKQAGGYSSGWNHRKTYTRIYDPRGFEFEISIENLLYILEHVNCLRGKGLDGEFVYGWDGTELVLIPVDSPDYKSADEYSSMLFNKKHFIGKEMIKGATYNTKQGKKVIYLGRFDYFPNKIREKKKQRRYYFEYVAARKDSDYSRYLFLNSLNDKIISIDNDNCDEDYAFLINDLEGKSFYSPVDYDLCDYKQVFLIEKDYYNYDYCIYYNYEMIPVVLHWSNGIANRFREKEISKIKRICGVPSPAYNCYSYNKEDNVLKILNKFKIFQITKTVLENGRDYEDK